MSTKTVLLCLIAAAVWAQSSDQAAKLKTLVEHAPPSAHTRTQVKLQAAEIGYPSAVTMDDTGNFVVAWASYLQDGSHYGIFGQRYDSTGTALGPEFRVNTYTTYGQTRPAVAADPTLGNFVVIWDSQLQDGLGVGVFGQRYGQILPVELMHYGVE